MSGVFSKVNEIYEELWKAIIRPPRDLYSLDQLGPSEFYLDEGRFKRRDFELQNKRELKIQCSHFEPVKRDGSYDSIKRPCVIYMHGNCSSRLEAIQCGCLKVLLPLEVSVLCFDFSGSGLSDGDYVSLGWYEKEDLKEVIAHLRQRPSVSTIGLWGRSMGAVTACLFADQDPSIAGLVVDSPFSSLRRLAEELAADFVGMKLPKFILGFALNMVKNTVLQKANFDLDRLEPIKHCRASFIPALFIAAKDDAFIKSHHARDCHDSYAGEKNFILVEGTHNSARPDFLHDSIAIFFRFALQLHSVPAIVPSTTSSVWEEVAMTLAASEQQRRKRLATTLMTRRQELNRTASSHAEDGIPHPPGNDCSASTSRGDISESEQRLPSGAHSRTESRPSVTTTASARGQHESHPSHELVHRSKSKRSDLYQAESSNSHRNLRNATIAPTAQQQREQSSLSYLPFEYGIDGSYGMDSHSNEYESCDEEEGDSLPAFSFSALDESFDIDQQRAIWKSLQNRFNSSQTKNQSGSVTSVQGRDDGHANQSNTCSTGHDEIFSSSIDFIPEAKIEELLQEIDNDYEQRLRWPARQAERGIDILHGSLGQSRQSGVSQPSSSCVSGDASMDASSQSLFSPQHSRVRDRFAMVAPHRTTEMLLRAAAAATTETEAPISDGLSEERTTVATTTSISTPNAQTPTSGITSSYGARLLSFKFW